MNFYSETNNYHSTVIFWYYCFIIFIINPTYAQYEYQSLIVISSQGNQFLPVNALAQLTSSSFVKSWKLCATTCNTNTFCRIFDYGATQQDQCRLFEGDINTLGAIIPSSLSDSIVGTIQITPSLFAQHGQSCSSVCAESRYLICGSGSVCECMPHTYWDVLSGMCLAQSPILGASCQQGIEMCREDLNYTCLQFNQCGPLSLLSGTTIADSNTVIQGSSTIGMNSPEGLAVYGVQNESLIVVDTVNNQIVLIQNSDSNNRNITVMFGVWNNTITFSFPTQIILDLQNASGDVYVSNYGLCQVILFNSIQTDNPLPKVVAGGIGGCGATPDKLNGPIGIALDSQKNVYVADKINNRIMLWKPNATFGILIAGQGVPGADSMSLDYPWGLFLDDNNSLLYVSDASNHRIQLFNLNGTPPYNGTTVAGGNGQGLGSHQLNTPCGIWVSKKTGTIYIADLANHRIQRWNKGATTGVTLAGSVNGIAGQDATSLYFPYNVIINSNETRMYVSDTVNQRVQRFDLISKDTVKLF